MKDNPTPERYHKRWMEALIEALKNGDDIKEWDTNWGLQNPPPPNENPIITIDKLPE
jgi:hypothetical protein